MIARSPASLLLAAAAAVASARPVFAEDPANPAAAEVAAEWPATECYVGEGLCVTLRVKADESFLRERGVALFQAKTSLPIHIAAPWLRGGPGHRVLALHADWPTAAVRTFAVNDGVVQASVGNSGARVSWVVVPSGAGELEFAGPKLRYAHTTGFDEDALGVKRPRDRTEASVTGPGHRLRVLPLPADGRPPQFSGAVGRFTMTATASRSECAAGETVAVTVRVEGDGDLTPSSIAAPRIEDPSGSVHVFGVTGSAPAAYGEPRTWTFDLAPQRSGEVEIPPFAFVHFDPARGDHGRGVGYKTARSEPVRIRVAAPVGPAASGGPTGTPATAPVGAGAPPPAPGGAESPSAPNRTAWIIGAVVAACLAIGALLLRRNRATVRPTDDASTDADPSVTQDRAAAAVAARARLDAAVAAGDATLAEDAFIAFLAARFGVPAAACVSPVLAARLAASGATPDDAAEAARIVEVLVSARYGPAPASLPPAVLEGAARVAARLAQSVHSAARTSSTAR